MEKEKVMAASAPVFIDVDGSSIAVRQTPGAAPGVVWLGGYKSDMLGTKAETIVIAWPFFNSGCGSKGWKEKSTLEMYFTGGGPHKWKPARRE